MENTARTHAGFNISREEKTTLPDEKYTKDEEKLTSVQTLHHSPLTCNKNRKMYLTSNQCSITIVIAFIFFCIVTSTIWFTSMKA